jgi:hypothetical protein
MENEEGCWRCIYFIELDQFCEFEDDWPMTQTIENGCKNKKIKEEKNK